mmetsp:Transcript_33758/g.66707  ORF Transcript_33758/g.66707 Transcript_33758/m.66707 type:complete len:220 (-) Transcript_33758:2534-3193(-)
MDLVVNALLPRGAPLSASIAAISRLPTLAASCNNGTVPLIVRRDVSQPRKSLTASDWFDFMARRSGMSKQPLSYMISTSDVSQEGQNNLSSATAMNTNLHLPSTPTGMVFTSSVSALITRTSDALKGAQNRLRPIAVMPIYFISPFNPLSMVCTSSVFESITRTVEEFQGAQYNVWPTAAIPDHFLLSLSIPQSIVCTSSVSESITRITAASRGAQKSF